MITMKPDAINNYFISPLSNFKTKHILQNQMHN